MTKNRVMDVLVLMALVLLYQSIGPPDLGAAATTTHVPNIQGASGGGNYPAIGSRRAPVTIIEFADFHCIFCQRFENETFDLLKTKLVDTGKVRFVAVDIVLSSEPGDEAAVEDEFCAGDAGEFLADALLAFSDSENIFKG